LKELYCVKQPQRGRKRYVSVREIEKGKRQREGDLFFKREGEGERSYIV